MFIVPVAAGPARTALMILAPLSIVISLAVIEIFPALPAEATRLRRVPALVIKSLPLMLSVISAAFSPKPKVLVVI